MGKISDGALSHRLEDLEIYLLGAPQQGATLLRLRALEDAV